MYIHVYLYLHVHCFPLHGGGALHDMYMYVNLYLQYIDISTGSCCYQHDVSINVALSSDQSQNSFIHKYACNHPYDEY